MEMERAGAASAAQAPAERRRGSNGFDLTPLRLILIINCLQIRANKETQKWHLHIPFLIIKALYYHLHLTQGNLTP